MTADEPTPVEVRLIVAASRLIEAQRALDDAEAELEAARQAWREAVRSEPIDEPQPWLGGLMPDGSRRGR